MPQARITPRAQRVLQIAVEVIADRCVDARLVQQQQIHVFRADATQARLEALSCGSGIKPAEPVEQRSDAALRLDRRRWT